MKTIYYRLYNKFFPKNCKIIFFKLSTLYKKIASNTLSQVISKALTAFISIFLIGILTKYLPIEMYGNYNKVYNYLWIFAFLADLGLYTITVREISRKKVLPEIIVWNVLTLRTILGFGMWIIAFILAFFLPWYHDTLTLIAIFIVWAFTVVSLINSSLLAFMQSQMKMEFSLISVVSGKLINIWLISFFLIYVFTDISQKPVAFLSVFIAGLLWIICNTWLNYFYAKKFVKIRYRFDRDYLLYIFKISLPYGLALFLSVIYFKVDIILLSILEPPELANISIALYWLPMKIVEVLMVVGGFYLNSILPSLSEKYLEKKYDEISKIFFLSFKILWSFWILILLLGNLFAEQIVRIIATPEYISPLIHSFNSVQALHIVFWVLLFHFLALCCIYMMIASERQSLLLWINLWVTLLNIIGNIILIPHYSFLGAGVVTLITQAILMCVTGIIVLRGIPIPRSYVLSFVWTCIFSAFLFFVFQRILNLVDIGDIGKILLFTPIFISIYIYGEYISSKKVFNLFQ